MIIWINGAFGSGKTQTAFELLKRIEKSHVFDAEEAGFYIRDNLPKELAVGDFQDYEMWRVFNREMLMHICTHYDGVVIVPMTVTNKHYLEEITKELHDNGKDIYHFTLLANHETLFKRLKGRGDKKGSWTFQQIERCVASFSDEYFKEPIDTDAMTIDQVVEYIADSSGIELLEDNRSDIRKRIDRLIVWKNHIRLFKLFG
jgi:broad-specificity NMP kinase